MEIELVQGDTSKIYKFQRKMLDNTVIKTLPKKMWITFKDSWKDKEAVFQKTLDSGITYNVDDNYYRFKIESKDTQDLHFGTYGFDIAIINEDGEKKTLLNNGVLKIISHYTKKENEV